MESVSATKNLGETERLVLKNKNGEILRVFPWQGENAIMVRRHDSRRVELHPNAQALQIDEIDFELLAELKKAQLQKGSLVIPDIGELTFASNGLATIPNIEYAKDNKKPWYLSLAVLSGLNLIFLAFIFLHTVNTDKINEELKQQVVRIVKQAPPKMQKVVAKAENQNQVEQPVEKTITKKTAAIRRMGALAVLGSLSSGKQRGGIDLGAVHTTAGPGLGGTQGSGGVQTSLYGKGIVSAPLGAGGNLQGGGGYGTKGKGGGQAGYGKLSLIGSAGTSTNITLGTEGLVEGGIDRESVMDVIRRNTGQIRFCYEQGLQQDPALAGRVFIRWIIDPNGSVKAASIQNTTLNSKQVEDCIMMRLKTWKFPLPSGGAEVPVAFPFDLKRQGHS